MDLLYMEALYTIMHKVGTTTDGHTHFVEDLYTYAKNAFNIDVGEHDKLLAKVSTEKVSVLFVIWETLNFLHLVILASNFGTELHFNRS